MPDPELARGSMNPLHPATGEPWRMQMDYLSANAAWGTATPRCDAPLLKQFEDRSQDRLLGVSLAYRQCFRHSGCAPDCTLLDLFSSRYAPIPGSQSCFSPAIRVGIPLAVITGDTPQMACPERERDRCKREQKF